LGDFTQRMWTALDDIALYQKEARGRDDEKDRENGSIDGWDECKDFESEGDGPIVTGENSGAADRDQVLIGPPAEHPEAQL
jgi:hypothetical protein